MDKRQLRVALIAYLNDRGQQLSKRLEARALEAILKDQRFQDTVLAPAAVIKKVFPNVPLGQILIELPITFRQKLSGGMMQDVPRYFRVPDMPNMHIKLGNLDIGFDAIYAVRRYLISRDRVSADLERLSNELAPYAGKHREIMRLLPDLAPYIEKQLPEPVSVKKEAARQKTAFILHAPMVQLMED